MSWLCIRCETSNPDADEVCESCDGKKVIYSSDKFRSDLVTSEPASDFQFNKCISKRAKNSESKKTRSRKYGNNIAFWIIFFLVAAYFIGIKSKSSQEEALTATPQKQFTSSPSFDCSKAHSKAETIICTDNELAILDKELSILYKQAQLQASDPIALKKIAVEEWKKRERTCSDRDCLLQWYNYRNSQLKAVINNNTAY